MPDHATSHVGLVYNFDLRTSGRGVTHIELEAIPHPDFDGYRPKKVWGTLEKVVSPSRDTSLRPIAVADDASWSTLKESSFEGGHLIALQFGGPDSSLNIAPMSKGANSARGTWGALERVMSQHLNAATALQLVYVELDIGYDDSVDPRIPSRIRGFVRLKQAGLFVGPKTPIDTYIGPPSDQTSSLTRPMIRFFRDVEIAATATGYATLQATPRAPNAPLDVIDYKTNVASQALRARLVTLHPLLAHYPVSGFRKKPGHTVATVQRHLMMFYNRFRNLRGPLRSAQLTAEDEYNLGLILREWRAQYDHTRPKSRGGKNSYSNLVLTHHRTNNKRGAGSTDLRVQLKRQRRKPVKWTYT